MRKLKFIFCDVNKNLPIPGIEIITSRKASFFEKTSITTSGEIIEWEKYFNKLLLSTIKDTTDLYAPIPDIEISQEFITIKIEVLDASYEEIKTFSTDIKIFLANMEGQRLCSQELFTSISLSLIDDATGELFPEYMWHPTNYIGKSKIFTEEFVLTKNGLIPWIDEFKSILAQQELSCKLRVDYSSDSLDIKFRANSTIKRYKAYNAMESLIKFLASFEEGPPYMIQDKCYYAYREKPYTEQFKANILQLPLRQLTPVRIQFVSNSTQEIIPNTPFYESFTPIFYGGKDLFEPGAAPNWGTIVRDIIDFYNKGAPLDNLPFRLSLKHEDGFIKIIVEVASSVFNKRWWGWRQDDGMVRIWSLGQALYQFLDRFDPRSEQYGDTAYIKYSTKRTLKTYVALTKITAIEEAREANRLFIAQKISDKDLASLNKMKDEPPRYEAAPPSPWKPGFLCGDWPS